jgi:NAD(P)-dependent dehydrogenase (short-subunit alcohol dehydrogenase family)
VSRAKQHPEGWYDGKVAIVTGGGSGIGAALVAALRNAGATAIAADIDPLADGALGHSRRVDVAGWT